MGSKKSIIVILLLGFSLFITPVIGVQMGDEEVERPDTTSDIGRYTTKNSNLKRVDTLSTSNTEAAPLYSDSKSTTMDSEQELQQNSISVDSVDLENPGVIKVIIKDSSTGDPLTYGIPGQSVDVSVLAKGPFSNLDLKVELKADVVSGTDYVIGSYTFTSITMNKYQQAWFNVTGFVLDTQYSTFGYDAGEVRNYFVQFINTNPFPDEIIFRGGATEDGGTGTGFLYMYGTIITEYIEYSNVTADDTIPITIAGSTWILTPTVQLRVINAPIWDFSLFVKFKYDVVYGIDDGVTTDQVISLLTGSVYSPGQYYYTPVDSNGLDAYIYIDESRTYGTGIGQTKDMYGILQVGDETGSGLTDADNYQGREFASIYIYPNVNNMAPTVEFSTPLDGAIISSPTIEIRALIRDQNSNYLINSILLNGTDVSADYNPLTGRLVTTYTLPSSTFTIFSLEIIATDHAGLTGSDTTVLQYYNPANQFPTDYSYDSVTLGETLYDDIIFAYSDFEFNQGDDLAIKVTPIISFGLNVVSGMNVYVSSPDSLEAGALATFYSSVSDPTLNTKLNISLGLAYEFSYKDLYFSGMTNIYFEQFQKSWVIPLGVTTFEIADFIGPDIARTLTHFELKSSMFLPAVVNWLAEVTFSLDIENLFKQVNTISADIDVTNGNSDITSLTWYGNDLKMIPVSSDLTGNSLDVTLSNFNYNFRFGVEIYFQFTISGKILTMELGPYNLNEWMARTLGINIPYIDEWIIDLSYLFPGSVSSTTIINERETDSYVSYFERKGDTQVINVIFESHGTPIDGATATLDTGSNTYTGTELGNGVYEFTLPSSYNGISTIELSKSGYQTTSINFEMDVGIVTVTDTETTRDSTTETVKETSIFSSTQIFTDVKSEAGFPLLILLSIFSLVVVQYFRKFNK